MEDKMAVGIVVVEDPHPNHPGFVTRRYTVIVVEMTPSTPGWSWIQKDDQGQIVSSKSGFPTEQAAQTAAETQFDGIWED